MTPTACVIAADIGSTNISLVAIANGKTVYESTFKNPQTRFGADIMTRIKRCAEGRAGQIRTVLLDRLQRAADEVRALGFAPKKLIASANTVMTHLLFGRDCMGMGVAPYTPTFTKSLCEYFDQLGLEVQSLPCVAAFGGGDVVAGILACGDPPDQKNNILVDLGTNAEVAIWNSQRALLTSAAAGPCFGAGAIRGTELIDLISDLLRLGQIDEGGAICTGRAEISRNGRTLTQKRIRDFQLAKAAVRTALDILPDYAGLRATDIHRVFVSGGFSAHINLQNAVACGLLPPNLQQNCVAVGNSSLAGACLVAGGADAQAIAEKCSYISLNSFAEFGQKFIDNIGFDGELG